MRARPRLTALGLGLAFALTAGAAPARAGFNATVFSNVSQQAGGLYLYSYIVMDSASSTLAVSEFDMILPTDANLQSITSAKGFITLYTAGDPTISFSSADQSTDIGPGMLGQFSFTSKDAPVFGSYSLLTFDDPNGFGPADVNMGLTIAPGAVPEPGSLLLLGLGLPCAIGLVARSRRRQSAASLSPPA